MSTIIDLDDALSSFTTITGCENLCVYPGGVRLWFGTKHNIGSRFWVWSARYHAVEYLSRWHGDPAGNDSMESELFHD
jgi:hypothetical protein